MELAHLKSARKVELRLDPLFRWAVKLEVFLVLIVESNEVYMVCS